MDEELKAVLHAAAFAAAWVGLCWILFGRSKK